jgi:hypothetical protein
MTTLATELAAVRGELARVDAKCSTLTGLAGAMLAFLVTQAGHGPIAARVLLAAAGVVLAADVVVLLLVLRPRLGSTGFRRYAVLSPAQVRALFLVHSPYDPDTRGNGAPGSAGDGIEAEDLQVLSQITDRKYRGLRRAVDLTVVAVVFMVFALLAGVIV